MNNNNNNNNQEDIHEPQELTICDSAVNFQGPTRRGGPQEPWGSALIGTSTAAFKMHWDWPTVFCCVSEMQPILNSHK